MGLGRIVVLLFLLLPLIEIACFVIIGNAIGLWATLAGVILSGLIGSMVLRFHGMAVLNDMQRQINCGQLPGRALADAALIGLAGLLLLIPGYFSDLIGLLLLLPPVRAGIYAVLRSRIRVVTVDGQSHPRSYPDEPATIELDHDDYRQR